MIKYAKEQFFLSVDDMRNASSSPKTFWGLVKIMKGSGSFTHIPALHDSTGNELVVDDESKSDLLNRYVCSISTINDAKRSTRTDQSLDITVNRIDVLDVLKVLKLGKASGHLFCYSVTNTP